MTKVVFLLIVVINGSSEDSDERLLFENVFDCNRFALYVERQATSPRRMNSCSQHKVTAYCMPKVVPDDTEVIGSKRPRT